METIIMAEVAANGPAYITIKADNRAFYSYKGYHILTLPSQQLEDPIDHAIVVLGWGTEAGVKYWIVQVCELMLVQYVYPSSTLCLSAVSEVFVCWSEFVGVRMGSRWFWTAQERCQRRRD